MFSLILRLYLIVWRPVYRFCDALLYFLSEPAVAWFLYLALVGLLIWSQI